MEIMRICASEMDQQAEPQVQEKSRNGLVWFHANTLFHICTRKREIKKKGVDGAAGLVTLSSLPLALFPFGIGAWQYKKRAGESVRVH